MQKVNYNESDNKKYFGSNSRFTLGGIFKYGNNTYKR